MKGNELKNKAALGFAWSISERFGNLISDFVISIFLARILAPTEFGLIAMVGIFIALLSPFIDAGLGSALMRKKEATNEDYSTVFWSNIGLAGTVYLILYLGAPLVAKFYQEPLLTNIIRVLGLVLPIQALNIVQSTRLAKFMNFRKISIRALASNIISGIIGLYLAFNGWSYWAIVLRQIINGIISTIFYWVRSSWYPSFRFSNSSFKEFFGFGFKLLLSSLLDTVFRNIYPLLIGKFYSASSLGLYNRAVAFKDIPQTMVTQVTSRVTYPILIELQDDLEILQAGYQRLMQLISFIYFPLIMGMMGLSKTIVLVLLTEKWIAVIPLLKGLAFVGLLYPIHALNLNVLTVKKRSDLFLYLEIVKRILTVGMILITFKWGIMGLIYGQIIQSGISLIINTYYSNRFIQYGVLHQLKDILPNFILSLILGLILMWGSEFVNIYTWWSLGAWTVVGVIIYLGISKVFNSRDLYYIYNLALEKYKQRRAFI